MPSDPCRHHVFLSHNHADQTAVADLARRLAEAGLHPWFAATHLIPGEPWQEAMEAALAASETVAVFVGPQGMGPWHNEEMRVSIEDAVHSGKRVIPVLLPGADPERISPFLKRRTWVDFRADLGDAAAFQLLLAGIRGETPFEAAGLFGIAWRKRHDFYRHISLPPNYIPRPELLAEVRERLLAGTGNLALTSAIQVRQADVLHGMGGIGKSVLARALCEDLDVQAAFPDGILWATLGQTPDLTGRLREWIETLGGIVGQTAPTLDQLKNTLAEALRDKACLLIVDDAWRKAHLEPFRAGGPACRLLITTRDAALAEGLDAGVYPVPVMAPDQAVALLEEWAQGNLAEVEVEVKATIVRRLGCLPLAVRLAGAQLRTKNPAEWLASFDARKLKARRVETVHDSLEATFALSLDALEPDDRRLYVALAIFKEDEPIPVVAITRLWSALDGRDAGETAELLADLVDRALLSRGQGDGNAVTFHDLLRDFMADELGETGRIAAHRGLLGAYRGTQQGDGWHAAPDDGYLYNHLAYHLDQLAAHDAAVETELHGLFADQAWLHARVPQFGYLYDGYLDDLRAAWWRIHATVKLRIDANEEPSELADCIRYALIQTSINALTANYIPEVIARAVEVSVWSAERALSVSGLIPDPYRRAAAYMALLGVPGLASNQRHQAERAALAATQAISDEWSRADGLVALAPQLTGELVWKGLEAMQAIGGDGHRAKVLAALAPHLTGELLQAALTKAQAIRGVEDRATALAALAPQLTGEAREVALRAALVAAEAIWQDEIRAQTLATLAPHLKGELLRAALRAARAIRDNEARVVALGALTPQLTGEAREVALRAAVVAARAIGDSKERAEALAILAPQLTGGFLQVVLATARAIRDDKARATALAALIPQLTGEARELALRAAVVEAEAIDDEQLRVEFLATLLPQLTGKARKRALQIGLAAARALPEQSRALALTALVSYTPSKVREVTLQAALTAARAIRDDEQRAKTLTDLVTHLTGKTREVVLRAALEATQAIQDTWRHEEAMATLAPQLVGEQLLKSLAATQTIHDEKHRVEALVALLPYLAGTAHDLVLQTGLDAARIACDKGACVKFLVTQAVKLRGQAGELAFEEALAMTQAILDDKERAEALIALASHLTGELAIRGLSAALMIADQSERARALVALAPSLAGEMTKTGLTAARTIWTEERASVLAALVPQLSGQTRYQTLQEGLSAAQAVTDEVSRVCVLVALSTQLTSETHEAVLNQARTATQAIRDEYHRAQALAALVSHLNGEAREEVLREGLAAAQGIQGKWSRAQALAAFRPYMPDPIPGLKAIRYDMADHLMDLAVRDRKDVLGFCSDSKLFTPPIFSPDTLAAIARHIIEICQEWEWL